jgi:rsbT antagonist protein RsbS
MEKIPIIKLGELLLVAVQVELHDRVALTLQEDLMHKLYETQAKAVLLDISCIDIVDSFMGRMLNTITSMGKIMGADTVIVGIQPAVAITLVEMGLSLSGVLTALNVEKGIELLKSKNKSIKIDKDAINNLLPKTSTR